MKTPQHEMFFPPRTRVIALPTWRNPRLYVPAHGCIQRWKCSSFYPAFRVSARLYKLALRVSIAIGLGDARKIQSNSWPLGEFVQEVLPRSSSVVVSAGTPGPAQKITVQLRDDTGKVLGYLKYGESEAARERLRQEHRILTGIPMGVGPAPLKYGRLGGGDALLTSPVLGKVLPATLPPIRGASTFLASLTVTPQVPVTAHPWVRSISDQIGLDPYFEMLSGKHWPVTIQHGDFTPWNLLLRSDGELGAIDWEYGTLEGFPHLDLAYYVLQTSALIYRWPPLRAMEYTVDYLTRQSQLSLSRMEARALTGLAAYDAYRKFGKDGRSPDDYFQKWRRAIWETSRCEK